MNTNTLETPSTTTTPPTELPVTPATATNETNPAPTAPLASEVDIDQAAIASIRKNLAAMPSTSVEEGINPNSNIRHEISPTLPSTTEASVVNSQESKPKTGLKALILGFFSKKHTTQQPLPVENITSFEAKKDQIQNPNLPATTPIDNTVEKAA